MPKQQNKKIIGIIRQPLKHQGQSTPSELNTIKAKCHKSLYEKND